jgi:multidrug efflux pump subunit AcrB
MLSLASKARPYLGAVVLCAALLTGGGVYSALRMPSSVYPEVQFPRIAVVAKVPDRDVTNMEVKVTRPLEEAVSGVIGVAQVRSKTIRGGSEISIDFNPGTDMKRAEQLTWNRIGARRSDLPPNTELTVEQMTPSVFPIISIVLTGGDESVDHAQLRDYAFYELAPLIKTVPDVLYANVAGGDVREIEVICRPDDLLAHGLSAADVADQIGALTPLQPVGRVESEPLAYMILVNNQNQKAREVEELVLSSSAGKPQPVRVKDVADVKVLHQDRAMSIGYNQRDAVVITVFRRLGGNTLEISRNVANLLEQKGLTLPAGDPRKKQPRNIQATVVYDQARFVESSVDNVRDAILIGGAFSILILLAFLQRMRALLIAVATAAASLLLTYLLWLAAVPALRLVAPAGWSEAVRQSRDLVLVLGTGAGFAVMGVFFWRATLIAALAIPVTLAITFLFLHWTGETLNLMSLGGLAVAIGLIIDDTVVVIENIARHLTPHGHAAPAPAPATSAANGEAPANAQPAIRNPQPQDPVDAASGEITGAVIGSTLTTVLVFIPLAFITGVYGQFFASLSWSLCIAVLVSMVISLTLVPIFAAKFLAGRPMPEPGHIYNFFAHVYEVALDAVLRFSEWVFAALLVAFRSVLGPRLGRVQAIILMFVLVVAPAAAVGLLLWFGVPIANPKYAQPGKPPVPLVKGIETGLMPSMDEGAFVIDYWAPSGSPLAETERKAKDIESILSKNPDVQAYVRRTGAELGLFATQTSRGDIQVVLRPAENDPVSLATKRVRPQLGGPGGLEEQLKAQGKTVEGEKENIRKQYRRRSVQQVMDEVLDEIHDSYGESQLKVEGVQIMADELNDLSGANKPVEVKLFGKDQETLRKWAKDVGEAMEKRGKGRGIGEVNSNVRQGNPDLMIQLDGYYADKLGLKPDAVTRQLKAIFQGQTATQVRESSLRITDVRVRYPDDIRFGKEANGTSHFDPDRVLTQMIVLPAPANAPAPANPVLAGPSRAVPLSALGDVRALRTPEEQWRENQQPAMFVTAELKENEAGLGSVVADIRGWMDKEVPTPPGYRWEIGGHYLQQQAAFRSLLGVMVVAILLVFIMLAFQFRSVVLPLLIFLTQPLSLVSGLFALWITNTPLNVSSYMGAILLIGLDMKNGILLVEYIQQLRKEGMALRPALLLAGRTRFRPILMTSLAAILGLFPLALGIGPGAQMQQPLAIMVIGGLTANMLFTRMVIPVGYLVLEGHKEEATPAAPPPVQQPAPAPAPAPSLGVVQG